MHPALRALVWVIAIQFALRFFLHLMLFHPHPAEDAEARALGAEPVSYAAEDGPLLRGYWMPAVGPAQRTIVCFHGNAETASQNAAWAATLAAQGSDVLLAEYRGYGGSTGSPSARGVERDADAAIRYLTEERHVALNTLVVYGRSLGGAAAIHVLSGSAQEARAGVLHSTFTSLHDLATNMLGVPLTRLVVDGWALNSVAKAPRVRAPIFQAHGDSDTLISYRIAEQLHAAFPPHPASRFLTIEGGTHSSYEQSTYDAIETFIRDAR